MMKGIKKEKKKKKDKKQVSCPLLKQFNTDRTAPSSFLLFAALLPKKNLKESAQKEEQRQKQFL